jgi:dihydrofolate reductase
MSGKVVVTEFITVDGIIQDPGGSGEYDRGGWSFEYDRGEDGDKFKLDELMAADAQLLGRVTYEGFAKAWPNMKDDAGFADRMNGMPKYVVSTTLSDPEWQNTTVIADDVAGQVAALKDQHDGDILIAGSAKLVGTLLEHDLVDEWRLMVFPTILGEGKRLFPDGIDRRKLTLVEDRALGSDGIRLLVYRSA